jgi:deoxyribodipyrimidine photo-lyase
MKHHINPKRVRPLNERTLRPGPIVYWMSRDQRSGDNWALLHAQSLALELKQPLAVVFCLAPGFPGAALRHYDFMLRGLQETEQSLEPKNIPFFLRAGDPGVEIPRFVAKVKAGVLVTDFDPLLVKRRWKRLTAAAIPIRFDEVDAHNIVPCWIASPKQEWGAYTIRPKIHRMLPEFLESFPKLVHHPFQWTAAHARPDWAAILRVLKTDHSVGPVSAFTPGPAQAKRRLDRFLRLGLAVYDEARNDPMRHGQSGLSPYLHFGHVSAQRVALEVQAAEVDPLQKESFVEELIVRRELADNFCWNNSKYASIEAFPAWARVTLDEHRGDLRTHVYGQDRFEAADTHDPLWNAAQLEMVKTGKMHGYLRMYWAKKILEWTRSPEQALDLAVRLNDLYELDGCDPNGYTGIAWSIGGVHDRAWSERQVFGKVRYMSYSGCKSKFDVAGYIRKIAEL